MKYIILDFGMVLAYPTCGNWFITPMIDCLFPDIDRNKLDECLKNYSYLLDKKLLTQKEEYNMFIELYTKLFKELGLVVDNKIISILVYDYVYNDSKYSFYECVKEELELLSSKYTLLMLTDNWPCVLSILDKQDLTKYFSKIYVSSIYDDKKERGTFFDYPIREYDIKKGEALYIDDNENLLTIGENKGLEVRQMDREKVIVKSSHQIIHDLSNI